MISSIAKINANKPREAKRKEINKSKISISRPSLQRKYNIEDIDTKPIRYQIKNNIKYNINHQIFNAVLKVSLFEISLKTNVSSVKPETTIQLSLPSISIIH